jgi:hypothetical protein
MKFIFKTARAKMPMSISGSTVTHAPAWCPLWLLLISFYALIENCVDRLKPRQDNCQKNRRF